LATAPKGGRNELLNKLAYRMGRMEARGWIDRGEIERRLLQAAADCGLLKDDGAKQCRATIKSGLSKGRLEPHEDLVDRDTDTAADGSRYYTDTGECFDEPPTGLLPITWDGETQLVFPTCLVKDLITEKSIGFIAGESTAGKTFVAVDLSFAIALGQPFFGKAVKLGGVLYVAAEAPGTIPARMQAARMHRAYPLVPNLSKATDGDLTYERANHLPIAVLKDVPDLATEKGLAQLIATAKLAGDEMMRRHGVPLRLVEIDTAIAAFGIKDWNNAADVSKVTRALSRIQNATDAAVLAVAHHGKDISKGVAGSFALKANVDTILSVLMSADDDALSGEVKGRHIALTKWRDGPTGWQSEFQLASVKIGVNDDGEDIFSAVVAPVVNATRLGAVKRSKVGRPGNGGRVLGAFKDAFSEALGESGQHVRVHGDGPQVRAVRRDLVRKAFYARYGVDIKDEKKAGDARRKAFGRGLETAMDGSKVHEGTWGGVEWLWKIDAA
jgi:hypothetical protein